MEILGSMWSAINMLITFFSNIVTSTITFIDILLSAVVMPPILSGWVAPLIGTSIHVVGSIGIISKILGR